MSQSFKQHSINLLLKAEESITFSVRVWKSYSKCLPAGLQGWGLWTWLAGGLNCLSKLFSSSHQANSLLSAQRQEVRLLCHDKCSRKHLVSWVAVKLKYLDRSAAGEGCRRVIDLLKSRVFHTSSKSAPFQNMFNGISSH